MSAPIAICGAEIFDGHTCHRSSALVIDGADVLAIREEDLAVNAEQQIVLDGGIVVPGFVDLQVNGGGGVLLNERPDADAIATICKAHAQFGTTALLATLITDTPEVTMLAIDAGIEAAKRKVPGFLGLHLEGPHLSVAKKGAHEEAFIRPMSENDLEALKAAKQNLENLLVTVAPETVFPGQIRRLAGAGIIVSLGHSDAGLDLARQGADAGARSVTHLFNAMSALDHRDPGMVGAALDCGNLYAGLIADGFHVDPAAISIALRAKCGPGRIYLVTDAMATIGTDKTSFTLNGRPIMRHGGRLTLADGTLAGADLDMISAVRYMAETVGTGLEEAVRMASLYPAQCMGIEKRYGQLKPGAGANFVHLGSDRSVRQVWIDGVSVFERTGGS